MNKNHLSVYKDVCFFLQEFLVFFLYILSYFVSFIPMCFIYFCGANVMVLCFQFHIPIIKNWNIRKYINFISYNVAIVIYYPGGSSVYLGDFFLHTKSCHL